MRPELLKEMETEIVVNGHAVPARIYIKTVYDSDIDLSWLEGEELLKMERRINAGHVTPTGIIVEAHACGEDGSDSLFGCLIEDSSGIANTIDDHGMIDNAKSELVRAIQRKIELLEPLRA